MNKFLEDYINKELGKPGTALDLGSGDNADVRGLKKKGWDCEGVDIRSGVDLEKLFVSENAPFDFVYSNYTIQKIKNKKQFIQTIVDNLKPNGHLFLHTFDKSDENGDSGLDRKVMVGLLTDNFTNINTRSFKVYDNEAGHEHWHMILEVTAQKK